MLRISKKLIIMTIILITIVTLFFGKYFFSVVFDESRYFSKNSMDYYILVHSKFIKQFPMPENVRNVVYHSSCGDGPKPESIAVHIQTSQIHETYLQNIKSYISKNNLKQSPQKGMWESSTLYVVNDNQKIEIAINELENGDYEITVEHRYYH